MMLVVTLTLHEFGQAVEAAKLRMINSENLNHATTYNRGYVKRLNEEVTGVCAEMAFAKWKNIFWIPGLNTFHNSADVKGVEIRGTNIQDGCLIVRKNDKPERIFILGVVIDQRVEFKGWIKGSEAMRDCYTKNPNGYREAWFVPQSDLKQMPKQPKDTS